jgi:hypothetical protein
VPDVTDRAASISRLSQLFLLFGATQCRGRSAVYEALSQEIARDDVLLELALAAPADQRRPSLLLAAVNALLANHPDAELAAYYPIHGGERPVDARLWPAFRGFCAEQREELARLLRRGATQTNEIRRCVALRLGLGHVARRWPGPVALVEVGASAGLNLLFDRYRYLLGGAGEREPGPGRPDVVISCEIRGGAVPGQITGAAPEITSRLGLDLEPVSLADPAARRWLEAFVWPERTDDLATLRGAVSLWLAAQDRPAVVRGDAVTDTAEVLAGLPGDEPVVVFSASLLSYLPAAARLEFAFRLREAAGTRPVAWVFAENPGLVASAGVRAPALAGPLARSNSRYVVGASLRRPGGGQEDELLALADPYLRWLAPARGGSDDFGWLGPS